MAKNGILVDYQYCTGCYSCEVACQSELDLPLGQWGVKVMQNGPWPIKDKKGNETDQYVYDFIPAFTKLCDLCAERQGEGQAAFLRLPLPGKMHGVRPCRRACRRSSSKAPAVPLGAALRIGR